jgi:hypothetical protein
MGLPRAEEYRLMSRSSRVALLIWACAKIALLSALIHETAYSRQPFSRASDQWEKAYKERDVAGMRGAMAAQRDAICASFFHYSDQGCPR